MSQPDPLKTLHEALLQIVSVLNRPQGDNVILTRAGVSLDTALFPLLVRVSMQRNLTIGALADQVGRDYSTVSRQITRLQDARTRPQRTLGDRPPPAPAQRDRSGQEHPQEDRPCPQLSDERGSRWVEPSRDNRACPNDHPASSRHATPRLRNSLTTLPRKPTCPKGRDAASNVLGWRNTENAAPAPSPHQRTDPLLLRSTVAVG